MPADLSGFALLETSPAGSQALCLSLAPTPEDVRATLQRIGAWLKLLKLDDATAGNAEIMLAEALNNVAEHAFADRAEAHCDHEAIRVHLQLTGGELHVCLRDRGNEMPGLAMPQGRLPEISDQIEHLPEGGFGWFLIREIARELTYDRENGWNRLKLVVSVTQG